MLHEESAGGPLRRFWRRRRLWRILRPPSPVGREFVGPPGLITTRRLRILPSYVVGPRRIRGGLLCDRPAFAAGQFLEWAKRFRGLLGFRKCDWRTRGPFCRLR